MLFLTSHFWQKDFLTTAFKQEVASRAEGYSNFSVTEEDATHCHILLLNVKDMDGADFRVSREVGCGTKMSILIIVSNLRKHKINHLSDNCVAQILCPEYNTWLWQGLVERGLRL